MKKSRHPISALLPAAVVVLLAWTGGTVRADDAAARRRLGNQLARSATMIMMAKGDTVEGIETALLLVREATEVDPDNVEQWRQLMDLALLGERDGWYELAVRQVVRLDPKDDVARLRRIQLAVERLNTAEDRAVMYRRLLAPERRARLGPAVVSRLAFDFALLERRRGNDDAFAELLAEAASVDPSNREAAAVAAGFFRMHVNDPFAEAELLTNLMLADPTDVLVQVALAEHLLENGAYEGAARIYRVAIANMEVTRHPVPGDLLADRAIAHWAAGDADHALATIRGRQQLRDDRARAAAYAEDRTLDPIQRAAVRGSVSPTLATVRLAILAQGGDPMRSHAFEQAMTSYDVAIRGAPDGAAPSEAETTRLRQERAWVSAWLGQDPERLDAVLGEVIDVSPAPDAVEQRFAGWQALRRGAVTEAIQRFEGLPALDAPSRIGLAEALQLAGRPKDAARHLLAVARAQPGTLLGIWSATELAGLVGRRLPLSDAASRMEKLIAGISAAFDRYPEAPNLAVGLRLDVRTHLQAFEPFIVNVEITNVSRYPLAIDRGGPIRSHVMLVPDATMSHSGEQARLSGMVIDLGRRLRLAPGERVVVPVDLRRYEIGELLDAATVTGVFTRFKATTNFRMVPPGGLEPLLLGSEQWTDTIRVDGVRVQTVRTRMRWLAQQLESMQQIDAVTDAVQLAMILHVVGPELPTELPAELFGLQAPKKAVEQAYERLGPVDQAWLLGVVGPRILPQPILAIARASEDRLVQMLYIMYQLAGADDPVIEKVMATGDVHLRYIAVGAAAIFDRRAEKLRPVLRTLEGASVRPGADAPGPANPDDG